METGELIVYTSADPVLQIAAHEDIIPLDELYRICEYARSITLERPALLGRIIARPYVGEPGNFSRTANRHDYAVSPLRQQYSTNWQMRVYQLTQLVKSVIFSMVQVLQMIWVTPSPTCTVSMC